jgi:hypothetical protein
MSAPKSAQGVAGIGRHSYSSALFSSSKRGIFWKKEDIL